MLCIVSFLHVLEANNIDVTSVSVVGDGYCSTLIAQSFYRMPAYKLKVVRIITNSRMRLSCREVFKKLEILLQYSQYIFSI